MPKAYWVACYRSVSDAAALAEYAKLGGPALVAAGGRVLARVVQREAVTEVTQAVERGKVAVSSMARKLHTH